MNYNKPKNLNHMEEVVLIRMRLQEVEDLLTKLSEEGQPFWQIIVYLMDESLITIDEIADFLEVSQDAIQSWKEQGKIPYHEINGITYYRKSEILKGY